MQRAVELVRPRHSGQLRPQEGPARVRGAACDLARTPGSSTVPRHAPERSKWLISPRTTRTRSPPSSQISNRRSCSPVISCPTPFIFGRCQTTDATRLGPRGSTVLTHRNGVGGARRQEFSRSGTGSSARRRWSRCRRCLASCQTELAQSKTPPGLPWHCHSACLFTDAVRPFVLYISQ